MAKKSVPTETVTIKEPNFQEAVFRIRGLKGSPYVQAKFSAKAKAAIRDKMTSGARSRKGQAREARDFQANYEGAKHYSRDGWIGLPAPAFRNACISACRLVGFKMTLAKLALFVVADGVDSDDGTPLVRIHGEPRMHEAHVRNATGVVDLRVRPMWEDWYADLRIRWDADLFTVTDITNLLMRVGQQVGIGEGRNDSKSSTGQGWGLFDVELEGELDVKSKRNRKAAA